MVFPNWRNIWAGEYGVWLCDGCGSSAETLVALTLVNFGTAGSADITNVVWKVQCSSVNSGLFTMTYAGMYTEDSGVYPAWTWAGASPDLNGCSDLCAPGPTCGGWFTIDVYVDITPCPTNAATVAMGFPIDASGNGSIYDNQGARVPWYDLVSNQSMIAYVYKSGPTNAVPGDTITYTIQYGKPGTAPLTSIDIIDTLPPYTHYVVGSAVPAPDVGYDPDIGPPARLRWTINPVPGNLPAWGPTAELRFSVSVDWGNGDSFEPGSGDVAAPEGQRLVNQAQVFFNGVAGAGCPTSAVNPPVNTVVKRFLFWIIGDNDVLFSPTYGQPPDEMTYSIFIRNMSTTKTWWDVNLWDTVPADLDAWGPNMGFDDPCSGWTMTPSGCAAATPGRTVVAGKTILTWRLDMPPQMTLEVRWKARVSATAQANGTVINTLSLREFGRTGIVGGTGHSGPPRSFTHLAPIVLPTMYTSYVGYAAGDVCCVGYLIAFFPLNKKTQFELRGIFNTANAFAIGGGVSASIGSLVGDCIGGFPGGGLAGCKVERIPAKFDPGEWADCDDACPLLPFNYIFKVTSNSPTLWQVLAHLQCHCHDNHTYAPSTTLSYAGLMHYVWRRDSPPGDPAAPGNGDCLELINTSIDPYGVFNPALDTTVLMFRWSYASLSWNYARSWDLCPESAAYDWNTSAPIDGPYRTISSQGRLIVNQGMLTNPQLAIGGHADNEMAYMPTRETGNTVSPLDGGGAPLPANFYGVMQGAAQASKVVVGNVGTVNAVYRIWRYVPDNIAVISRWPGWLSDTCGSWQLKGTHSVPAGLAAANNPRIYPADGAFFDQANTLVLSKVELVSGGPIQVAHGIRVGSFWSGGSVVHPSDGTQAGLQYWMHLVASGDAKGNCDNREMFVVDVFCPKQGMAVRMVSEDGYSASYTTTGPDQVIAFMALSSDATRNYRVDVLPNPAQGSVLCQMIACAPSEKGYTAPFLQQGVHYEIIAPPVVYVGQSFWITVIVKEVGGQTKLDYCGTTSFTSTDPGAKIEGTAMDTYNFTWSGTVCDNNGGLPNENGVRRFVNVTFTKLGMQTVVAMDTIDGSINGLTAVLVVATDIKLSKSPRLAVAASGDTVQFRVCWSNYSSASAFSFTITDALPVGTTFVPEAGTWAFACSGETVTVGFSTSTSPTVPPAASFTTGNPTAPTRWLRWTLPYAPVFATGCACYRVTVN